MSLNRTSCSTPTARLTILVRCWGAVLCHFGASILTAVAAAHVHDCVQGKSQLLPLHPRTTPFPEETSMLGVVYGVLLWAGMNAATPLGAWGRSVISLVPPTSCVPSVPTNPISTNGSMGHLPPSPPTHVQVPSTPTTGSLLTFFRRTTWSR